MATGARGIDCRDMGTHPMAAALANGSHAATDAITGACNYSTLEVGKMEGMQPPAHIVELRTSGR